MNSQKFKSNPVFDYFILAGLLMNVLVILFLVGAWAFSS